MTRLVLASGSAYRRVLLERLGLAFDCVSPGIDEAAQAGERPEALAARLAEAKARAVREERDDVVIGSDQVAALDGEILRKPGSHEQALLQLQRCQGRTVDFFTAVFVLAPAERTWHHVDRTRVEFAERTEAELDRYLRLEQPYDCAGGFKAEGLGIALFRRIESEDPTALIGLPLIRVVGMLTAAGLDPLGAPLNSR
jgi:septum formation protein